MQCEINDLTDHVKDLTQQVKDMKAVLNDFLKVTQPFCVNAVSGIPGMDQHEASAHSVSAGYLVLPKRALTVGGSEPSGH